jgi:hypothetical protein
VSATPPSSNSSARGADSKLRLAGAVLGGAAFAALLTYLWRVVESGDLDLGRARPGPLAASMVLLLSALAAQALAWHLLVRAAGGAHAVATDCGRWALSLLGKYVPGKVFNAVGRIVLYRGAAPGMASLALALATEALLSLTAAACVAAGALAVAGRGPPSIALAAALTAAGVGLLASSSALFERAVRWLAARLFRSSAPAAMAHGRRAAPLVLLVGSYLLMGLALHLLILAWYPASAASLAAVVGALCLSGIAGIAAFVVPAGLGVREGTLVWVLSPMTGTAAAVFIAVAARVWLTLADLVAVAVGAWLLKREQGGHG